MLVLASGDSVWLARSTGRQRGDADAKALLCRRKAIDLITLQFEQPASGWGFSFDTVRNPTRADEACNISWSFLKLTGAGMYSMIIAGLLKALPIKAEC